LNNTLGVALAADPRDASPIVLGRDCLSPVGFARDEGMLPYPARSFLGYRLLTEYFAFPQKFLFFDLALPALDRSLGLGSRLEVFLYLNRSVSELGRVVSAETFSLGCTPIVNLYRQRAEPVILAHTSYEVQVVPDRRQPFSHEVYSIDRVTASPPSGERQEFQPFFSVRHDAGRGEGRRFWHATRRGAEGTLALGDRGTEVYLSLVDLDFRPSVPADWTLDVETTCLNRDLPRSLPYGGGQPRLQLREGTGSLAGLACVTPPTPTLRLGSRRGFLWRLVSHLALNHLSLVDDPRAEALREILRLYDFGESDETHRQIEGLISLGSRRAVGGLPAGGALAFCRGQEVTLEFDEEQFTGGGLFLFASVLERFLALYCTTNSFVRTVARVKGRKEDLRRWPARIGENVLV
jgi:type VI secretion system protein ImpG